MDPMLRSVPWVVDVISVAAEYYTDVDDIHPHTKAHKPYMRMIMSEGWAPYIPPTPSQKEIG